MSKVERTFNRIMICLTIAPVVAFAWFIWPTPWRTRVVYVARVNGQHHYHVHYLRRANVFTGENQCGHSGMFGMVDWHPCTSK